MLLAVTTYTLLHFVWHGFVLVNGLGRRLLVVVQHELATSVSTVWAKPGGS